MPNDTFVDTNLFLRYLTNDIAIQANAVEKLLHRAARGEIHLHTTAMAIAEIVWTLESFYKLPKDQIKALVLSILNTPGLTVTEHDQVFQAAIWYEDKNVDFIDAYNAAWMLNQGLRVATTFDKKHFQRFEHIKVNVPDTVS